MSDVLSAAMEALSAKIGDATLPGSAKFVIGDAGAIIFDDAGLRTGDEDADVTLTASADTFQAIMEGTENPTAAFMTGKLTVDGDMGLAMQLSGILV